MSIVEIYTDGACAGNPGPGGWGALLIFKDITKEIYGYQKETTNNQMEIQAAISALQYLNKPCKINLYTDSKYLKHGITEWMQQWKKNNWKKSDKKPVKNLLLWQDLDHERSKHDINWLWVKGHSDNKGNIIADKLALKGKNIALKLINSKEYF